MPAASERSSTAAAVHRRDDLDVVTVNVDERGDKYLAAAELGFIDFRISYGDKALGAGNKVRHPGVR